MSKKTSYVYREFDNQFGYEENTNVTTTFDNLEDLIEMINKRKEFYDVFWNKRRIIIDIVPKGSKGKENE